MKANKGRLTTPEGELREDLTASELSSFKSAAEVLSPALMAKLGIGGRGPQKAPVKQRISIRLSAEVVGSFKGTGRGWQSRIDVALQTYLKEHSI